MQKRKNRLVRDPYYHWKALNMILAFAILILAFLVLTGREEKLSGIMELAKNKKVIGYICSVFSGILAVALILNVIWLWFI